MIRKNRMGRRGRVSSATSLMTISPVEAVPRQSVPHELTDEEAEVWHAVINSMPADWFAPATVPMLTQYCRHTIHARRIAELLEKACSDKSLKVRDYERLLKMQKQETEAIALLAVKMRLAQQSTIVKTGNKKIEPRKPWEG